MAITYEYDIPLSTLTTFRTGGVAKKIVNIQNDEDLLELFDTIPAGTPWFMIGGGSNVVFPDGDCNVLLIRLLPGEIKIVRDEAFRVQITAAGGTEWDNVVQFAVDHNLAGIEALSAIPGTAGATPIQNVGAYGVEIKDVLVSVRAFDVPARQFVSFSNHGLKFAYRDSMFKHEGKGKYIITEITLDLERRAPIIPSYPGVQEYLTEQGITTPNLKDIREAITTIRWKKLPDPREIASVGSFFKNPIIAKEEADKLKLAHPHLAVYQIDDNFSKVGAGSLIDTAGLKGTKHGNISIYEGNALVLVNDGGATREELSEVIEKIRTAVHEKFGVSLETEPELLNF